MNEAYYSRQQPVGTYDGEPVWGEPAPAQRAPRTSVVSTVEAWAQPQQPQPAYGQLPAATAPPQAQQNQQQSYQSSVGGQPKAQFHHYPPVPQVDPLPGAPAYSQPVLVQRPAVVVASARRWGVYPEQVQCSRCTGHVTTNVVSQPGCGAFLWGSIICLLGGWFGCCLIPCCVDSCQDQVHYCPNCNSPLGSRTGGRDCA